MDTTKEQKPKMTPLYIAESVEDIVVKHEVKYITACRMFADDHEMDVEDLAQILPKPLIAKLKFEAENLLYLPKSNTATLPC